MANQNVHNQQYADRTHYTDLIIHSTARNKVVIAGPGTGKTFAFRKLLETKKAVYYSQLAGDGIPAAVMTS